LYNADNPYGKNMKEAFRKFANKISYATGTAMAFVLSVLVIIVWGLTGPAFHFSDTWQLVINTGTTIITFLMVFLIQNTQNRDSKAVHLKLDELIRASGPARQELIDLEDLTDEELAMLDTEFREMHDKQVASDVMLKLHKKIDLEKQRRHSIKGAGRAISSFLNTSLSSKSDNSKK
jgi:low affinity Fe/Cu permease